jgi:NADPH2:quinone reductase
MAAIQLGVARGARVLATAGGPDKVRACRELGADLAIDHRSEDFTERVLDATDGRGADVVCDLVAGPFTQKSWDCIAREGRYLAAGFADDPANGQTGVPLRPVATANFEIVGVMLAWMSQVPAPLRRMGLYPFSREVGEAVHADLLALWAAKRIRPLVTRRVPLAQAPAALEDHAQRRRIGRSAVELRA